MTFGAKLSKLRKDSNYTQEQLAGLLGVSRQSISKWESDVAYPETDKLIRLSELFQCSLDYLLKDGARQEDEAASPAPVTPKRERRSQRTLWGLPLWAIGRNVTAIVAVGMRARGIVAVGMCAQGLLSVGMLSFGVLSVGMLSLGLLSVGCFALGCLAIGSVSIGFFSLGAVAMGALSSGTVAVGKYAAIGNYACGMIAIGGKEAAGTLYQSLGGDTSAVLPLLDAHVPAYLSWAKALFQLFL